MDNVPIIEVNYDALRKVLTSLGKYIETHSDSENIVGNKRDLKYLYMTRDFQIYAIALRSADRYTEVTTFRLERIVNPGTGEAELRIRLRRLSSEIVEVPNRSYIWTSHIKDSAIAYGGSLSQKIGHASQSEFSSESDAANGYQLVQLFDILEAAKDDYFHCPIVGIELNPEN